MVYIDQHKKNNGLAEPITVALAIGSGVYSLADSYFGGKHRKKTAKEAQKQGAIQNDIYKKKVGLQNKIQVSQSELKTTLEECKALELENNALLTTIVNNAEEIEQKHQVKKTTTNGILIGATVLAVGSVLIYKFKKK